MKKLKHCCQIFGFSTSRSLWTMKDQRSYDMEYGSTWFNMVHELHMSTGVTTKPVLTLNRLTESASNYISSYKKWSYMSSML